MITDDVAHAIALNAVCPYFTMFPLNFPVRILRSQAKKNEHVLDPFCGRGTTNFAARLLGLRSLGIDSSPVAAAITAAKIASATPDEIVEEAAAIITSTPSRTRPRGEFWQRAYHASVMDKLCRLRSGLLQDCSTDARRALRGIILGALHGPRTKGLPSYFSNQCTRTYAPKPRYATNFWRSRKLAPPKVDVLGVIRRRAERYYLGNLPRGLGEVHLGDSRDEQSFSASTHGEFTWIITSPPYYGMRTYIPDQWLRNWFLGGPDVVSYSAEGQLVHSSPKDYVSELRQVWQNSAKVCRDGARLVIRFGGISDRRADPLDLVKQSLKESDWTVETIRQAGLASKGKRQADSFLRERSNPMMEYDVWARLV